MCAYHTIAKCQGGDYQLNPLLFGCQAYVRARGVQDTQRWAFTLRLPWPRVLMRVCVV